MCGGVGIHPRQVARRDERHGAGLGRVAARLARGGGMIQITPQMRILVAVEVVDGRNYAPSIDMQSSASKATQIAILGVLGRRITSVTV